MNENEACWPERGERAGLIPGEVRGGRRVRLTTVITDATRRNLHHRVTFTPGDPRSVGLTPTIVVADEVADLLQQPLLPRGVRARMRTRSLRRALTRLQRRGRAIAERP